MNSFLLCDPALLMPPPADAEGAVRFWTRLIEWSVDRRLRLGPAGYELVLSLLGTVGWPKREHNKYPPGLGQLAHRALSTLLQQVAVASDGLREDPPTLSPEYLAVEPGGQAIGTDSAVLHDQGLMGVATAHDHWRQPADILHFDPPPPSSLGLVFEPHGRLQCEIEHAVYHYFESRRFTIVGGIPSAHILEDLANRFDIKQVRWIGSERSKKLNLSALDGLQPGVDVVYCITGHIGHADSTKAKKCCKKRGVKLVEVEHGNDIVGDLSRRHGGQR